MAIGDFLDVASDQLSYESDSVAIPSYLKAANNHQAASGSDESTASWLGKFALTATARAVTSVFNIVPETVNWLGGTMETLDTYNAVARLDQNLADYYLENKSSVDVVGDIAASFVPGMAGVKILNKGQKALDAYSAGKGGFNMAAHVGLLPSRAAVLGKQAGIEMAAASQTFQILNANVMKSVAAGYAQSALESAAFLGASQVAMSSSPLFDNQDASDLVWNSLGGGLVGGAIMGSIAAAQTYGAIKSGAKFADRILNPAASRTAVAGNEVTDKLTFALYDLHHPPQMAFPVQVGAKAADNLVDGFQKRLTDRESSLMNTIYEETNKLVKDTQLAKEFADSLRTADFQTAVGNIEFLKGITRAGSSQPTAIERLANKFKQGLGTGEEPNLAVMFVKLRGEGAMTLSPDKPTVLNLADTVGSGDAKMTEAKITSFVGKQKFKHADGWAPSLAEDHLQAEARYIWSAHKEVTEGVKVSPRDIPMLERAMQSGLTKVELTDGRILHSDEMLGYIKEQKLREAYLLQEAYPTMTTEEIAKRINVKRSLLEGEVNTADDVSDWIATDYSKGDHLRPTYAKLAYDVKPYYDENGHMLDAVAHAKANQKEFRQAADIAFTNEFGQTSALFPRIGDKAIWEASRFGSGGSLISSMNENYGTVGSIMQTIGKTVNGLKSQLISAVDDRFTSFNHAVLNNQAASDDLVKAYNMVLGSPEKYVLTDDGFLRMKKVHDAQKAGKNEWPALLDKNSPLELKINTQEARDFLQQWITHNDEKLLSKANRLAHQIGTTPQDLRGTLYIPPPDPKNYKYFALVVDSSVTGTGHTRMIHAADEHSLEQLIGKVKQERGLKVITKSQSEDFHKAMQDYEYGLGINENYIDSALARKGVAAPYFAVTDPQKIVMEMMDWRKRADVNNMREWVKLKYAPEFEALGNYSKSYDNLALSQKSYAGKYAGDSVKNPYANLVKTALDVSSKEEYPVWTPLNRLLENGVSRMVAKLHDTMLTAPSGQELDRVSDMLREAGISANFSDPATMLLANHTAPKPVLEDFIRKANSALSFLMLRADPLNAVNNGVGHSVLYGTETRDLIKNILKGNEEAAGELALLSRVKIPGENLGSILSPGKLATAAYRDYAKMLSGDADMLQLADFFKRNGWMPDMIEQERTVMNAVTLRGTESAGELQKRMTQLTEATKTLAKPFTKLNQGVEDMNRFVSAHTAKSISDIAVKHGIMTEADQLSYINTFVNRTNGNYIANQRPMLFQGPAGQAIGLFQTYQFNMLQQAFRYIGEGGNKSAAVLMGLQGSIYGMNGLPAFNAINTHLVGNAGGNVSHKDIISQTYELAGKTAGDWLVYGTASQMFLHPDLKVNLYSRGDINPRHLTIVPTNPADVPVVGAITKLLTSIKTAAERLGAGGAVYQTFLQGIEHAGISRPLAGLAQVAQAFGNENLQTYSTTAKGSIIGASDLFSLTTFARMAGGRPLDEAIANDAVYRIRAYSAARTEEINALGAALKTKIQSGNLDHESVTGFMREYVKRGGKQEQFNRFMMRQMKSANVSTANQLADSLKTPESQAMQAVMGGYTLQDLAGIN